MYQRIPRTVQYHPEYIAIYKLYSRLFRYVPVYITSTRERCVLECGLRVRVPFMMTYVFRWVILTVLV
jgi:hypothetical protein